MAKETELISKNVNVIPQVFYDIIARFIPGITLIVLSIYIQYGNNVTFNFLKGLLGNQNELIHVSFSLIFLMFLAAYMISLVLMGVWSMPLRIIIKLGIINSTVLK
jgi:hypothetical protein